MIKRTPQEIADFFQGYVAMDMDERWFLYPSKPKLDVLGGWWNDEERSSINISKFVKIDGTPEWKDSLYEPRMINSSSDGETDTQLIRMLSNMMIANICTHEYTEDLHQVADHYGKRELLERLLMACAGMGVEVSRYLKGNSVERSLTETFAELELLLEQVKYLVKIDTVDLGEIKKQKIAMHLFIIAQASHEKSTDDKDRLCRE